MRIFHFTWESRTKVFLTFASHNLDCILSLDHPCWWMMCWWVAMERPTMCFQVHNFWYTIWIYQVCFQCYCFGYLTNCKCINSMYLNTLSMGQKKFNIWNHFRLPFSWYRLNWYSFGNILFPSPQKELCAIELCFSSLDDSWPATGGKQKIASFSTLTSYFLCMKKLLMNPNDWEFLFSYRVWIKLFM